MHACLFVYVFVCLSVYVCPSHTSRTTYPLSNFLCMLSVTVARSSGGTTICDVLTVLWIMSCISIMARGFQVKCGTTNSQR